MINNLVFYLWQTHVVVSHVCLSTTEADGAPGCMYAGILPRLLLTLGRHVPLFFFVGTGYTTTSALSLGKKNKHLFS
jgi:hypothetical protein